jgi:hypothetical protein
VKLLFAALDDDIFNRFDPAEIAANRRGEITAVQAVRLDAMIWGRHGTTLFMAGVFFIVPMGVLFNSLLAGDGIPFWLALMVLVPAVVLGYGLFSVARNWTRVKRDKAANAIRQTTGELGFDRKHRYFFRAGERDLILPVAKNITGLLPGLRYTVFYLEESGFILSVEQLGITDEPAVLSALRTILMQVNRFTADDLQANQQGALTAAQQTRVLLKASWLLGLVLIPLVLLGFVMNSIVKEMGDDMTPILFSGSVAAILLIIGLYPLIRAALDVVKGVPQIVKGVGRKHTEKYISTNSSGDDTSRTYYYYIIGKMRFKVTQVAYAAFIDKIEYAAYYLPRTKTMLAIEPIDVPDNY